MDTKMASIERKVSKISRLRASNGNRGLLKKLMELKRSVSARLILLIHTRFVVHGT